uniref:Uncharacterized protein n=1 Tax=uncultured Desulfobacterium sp. TaxID=201089 RepID=E1YAR3_9BACT|nr:unknown protein [uncultured Desulfobacterium sp.]
MPKYANSINLNRLFFSAKTDMNYAISDLTFSQTPIILNMMPLI